MAVAAVGGVHAGGVYHGGVASRSLCPPCGGGRGRWCRCRRCDTLLQQHRMRILPLSALLLSWFAERSRDSAKRDAGGRGQWPRPLSGFLLHRVIPLIHRQFRVSYFIQTRNSRLAESDRVPGGFSHPPTPHQALGLSAYQRPQPQMLGPLLCDGNARSRKFSNRHI